jgi:hypothetical protein
MAPPTSETRGTYGRLQKLERQVLWLVGALLMAVFVGETALVLATPPRDRLALAALAVACA